MEELGKWRHLRTHFLNGICCALLTASSAFAHEFVLHSQTGAEVSCRFCGCQLTLQPSVPLLLPHVGKSPCSIIFGTKFKVQLSDDGTVRCVSRKPGRDDYLWYDIELVLDEQEDEEREAKKPATYHWAITKRELNELPLRLPEYAIVIHLPSKFIESVTDEHGKMVSGPGTFYLPTFKVKAEITPQELEDALVEVEMRQIKDKRFFSTTTPIGTVPPAIEILNKT
ncbi:MAG: hypothetical protein M1549_01535 [Candidatus Dependentiae bacterium]|nr:hypothetical protein [Candidatus Dependentiae bacterium]